MPAAWPLICHSWAGRGASIGFTGACCPQAQRELCSPCGTARCIRALTLLPAQPCTAKAAAILLLFSREALLWNYSWKKRLLQPGCLFWGMCCHGILGRRDTSPVLEQMWRYQCASCPKSLAPAPQGPQWGVTLSFPGWQPCFKYSTSAVKFLKFLAFTLAKQVDIPLLNGRVLGAQIHLHEFSVFNRWH